MIYNYFFLSIIIKIIFKNFILFKIKIKYTNIETLQFDTMFFFDI